MIERGIRKSVDPILLDQQPVGNPEFGTDKRR
jgi:hypothetical protein